ncbi:hypothetical protein VPHK165_0002 [Vibrio phage K165]
MGVSVDPILIGAIVGIVVGIFGAHHDIGIIPTLTTSVVITLLLII